MAAHVWAPGLPSHLVPPRFADALDRVEALHSNRWTSRRDPERLALSHEVRSESHDRPHCSGAEGPAVGEARRRNRAAR